MFNRINVNFYGFNGCSVYREWWKKNVVIIKLKSSCNVDDSIRDRTIILVKMKISNYRGKIAYPIRISCCSPALKFNKLI